MPSNNRSIEVTNNVPWKIHMQSVDGNQNSQKISSPCTHWDRTSLGNLMRVEHKLRSLGNQGWPGQQGATNTTFPIKWETLERWSWTGETLHGRWWFIDIPISSIWGDTPMERIYWKNLSSRLHSPGTGLLLESKSAKALHSPHLMCTAVKVSLLKARERAIKSVQQHLWIVIQNTVNFDMYI